MYTYLCYKYFLDTVCVIYLVYFFHTENCICIGANNFTPALREYCISEYPPEYTLQMDKHWEQKTKCENHYAMLLAAPGITNEKKYIVPPGKENGIFCHKWLGRCGYLTIRDLEILYKAEDMDFTQVPSFFFQVLTSLPQKPKDYDKYVTKYLKFQQKYLYEQHSNTTSEDIIDLSNSDTEKTDTKDKTTNNNNSRISLQHNDDKDTVKNETPSSQSLVSSTSNVIQSMFAIYLFVIVEYYSTCVCYIYPQMQQK